MSWPKTPEQHGHAKPGEGIVIRAMDSSWSFKAINLNYKD